MLYKNILVVINPRTPLAGGSSSAFASLTAIGTLGSTVVFSEHQANLLYSTLSTNSALSQLIARLVVEPESDLASKLTSILHESHRYDSESSSDALGTRSNALALTSQLRDLTLSRSKLYGWDTLHQAETINLEWTESLAELPLKTKLGPKRLTVTHSHCAEEQPLGFAAIDAIIDLSLVQTLVLDLGCSKGADECMCLARFADALREYLAENGGLPNLTQLELLFQPQSEWLGPSALLEAVLLPFGTFVNSLCALAHLSIDFHTPLFKMYSADGMPSQQLNLRCNEKLLEAFFLPFTRESATSVSRTLRSLALPDFFMSFVYYKPNFYELFLHTCTCSGCNLTLHMLEQSFLPLGEEDVDPVESLYVLVGLVLDKLQNERRLLTPDVLFLGDRNSLHSHLHCGTSCSCDLDVESAVNWDNLVTTYVMHQLRPIADYLALVFVNMERVLLHGVPYERHETMTSVFDPETYPVLPEAEKRGPYGRFSL